MIKYIIHSIAAGIFYNHNIDNCYSDMKIIIKDLQEILPMLKLLKKNSHPTGEALSNWFDIDGGVYLSCVVIGIKRQKMNMDGLTILE